MRPFHRVEIRFGTPMHITHADVEAAGSEREALRTFTDELMAQISTLSGRPYVDTYIESRSPRSPHEDFTKEP